MDKPTQKYSKGYWPVRILQLIGYWEIVAIKWLSRFLVKSLQWFGDAEIYLFGRGFVYIIIAGFVAVMITGNSSTDVRALALMRTLQQYQLAAEEGFDLLVYDEQDQVEFDTQSEFQSGVFSEFSFESGETDLNTDGTDTVYLGHWGENPSRTQYPTAQWWDDDGNPATNYNWRYRQCFDVDFTGGVSNQTDYQVYLDFDTASLVSSGKMLSDGSDIRFADILGNTLDYYIADDMNTSSTRIWLRLNSLPAGSVSLYCMYYGAQTTPLPQSSREDVFTYSSSEDLYYLVSDTSAGAWTEYASYTDNNTITIGSDIMTLNQYEANTLPVMNYLPTTTFSTNAPIQGSFEDDGTDALAPASFAATEFVYRMERGLNTFDIVSPFCDANIEVENGIGAPLNLGSFTVTQGSFNELITNNSLADGIPNDNVVFIESTNSCPVLVSHHSVELWDSFIFRPPSTELIGIGSTALELTPLEDNTNITLYRSDGSTTNYNLDRGQHEYINDPGGQGSENAQYLVADKPISAKSIADNDGLESTTFLSPQDLGSRYYIPQNAQYITIATPPTNTTVTVDLYFNAAQCGVGAPNATINITSSATHPGKGYFGSTSNGLNIPAMSCMVGTGNFFAYYEHFEQDAETNLWSAKQNRPYREVDPTYVVNTVEAGTWSIEAGIDWSQRLPFDVTNTTASALTEEPVFFSITDPSLIVLPQPDAGAIRIAGGLGDGSDNLPFSIDKYDPVTGTLDFWVQFPSIAASSTSTAYIYFDTNSPTNLVSTADEIAVFSYSTLKDNYYIVDTLSAASDIDVISFADNNTVTDGTFTYNLSEGAGFGLDQTDIISTNGPIHAAFTSDTNDSAIPISFAGTEFAAVVNRSSDSFSFYAPYDSATIWLDIVAGGGWSTMQTLTLGSGSAFTLDYDIPNNTAFRIRSSEPILAFHRNGTSDSKPLYPVAQTLQNDSGMYEIYGLNNRNFQVAAIEDDTTVTIYRSDGTSSVTTIDFGTFMSYTEGGGASQGEGPAIHLVADKPIAANSLADSDGSETAIFLPQQEFSDEYVFSQPAQYAGIVAMDPGTQCTIYDENFVQVGATGGLDNVPPQTGGNNSDPFPNNIHIGGDDTSDEAFFDREYVLQCNNPVYAMYEHHLNSTITDETTWLSWAQARKRAQVEPIVQDIDIVPEEGLYYRSGFDTASTALDPIASVEYTFDSLSNDFPEDVTWEQIITSGTIPLGATANGVTLPLQTFWSAADGSDCATAIYTPFSLVPLGGYLPPAASDNRCLKIRFELRTGDTQFTPSLDSFQVIFRDPRLLDDETIAPLVDVPISSTDPRNDRLFKIVTNDPLFDNSKVYSKFNAITDDTYFIDFDVTLYEKQSSSTTTQFAFPPFTTPPTTSTNSYITNPGDEVSIYFNHQRSAGPDVLVNTAIIMDLTTVEEGPQASRTLYLNFKGN